VIIATLCLGFSLGSKDKTTAKLKRDDVPIGLAVNSQDSEHASRWLSVGDVDALWREFDAKDIEPGIIPEADLARHLREWSRDSALDATSPT